MEIKCCPYCKGEGHIVVLGAEKSLRFLVQCKECGFKGPWSTIKNRAISGWNIIMRRVYNVR